MTETKTGTKTETQTVTKTVTKTDRVKIKSETAKNTNAMRQLSGSY